VNNLEQVVNALLQRNDSLKLERQQSNALEQTVAMLFQCMDTLEHKCNQLRAMVMPQQSNSDSSNQNTGISRARKTREEQEGWEAEPMETEDNAPSQVEVQEAPDNESGP